MPETKRTIHHSIKMTPEEDALLQQRMQSFGIKNQSAFLRAMALNGYMVKLNLPEIHEMTRLLKNLSNNVNQIARRMNEHGSIYETEIDEIQEQQKELWSMMNEMLTRMRSPHTNG